MRPRGPITALVLLALGGATVPPAGAQDTADHAVRWQGDGLRLEMAPLTRDQVLAFFMGRGFDRATAAVIATEGCVFRSAIGNADAQGVSIDLTTWRMVAGAASTPLRTRRDWAARWQTLDLAVEPRVAFKWALFPTQQTFLPGDYNWGMLTFGLPSGTAFDLDLVWEADGTPYAHRLHNLTCAP